MEQQDVQQQVLKFVPFMSAIESAFWVRYCRDKLETIQLNETPLPLRLTYGVSIPSSSITSNATSSSDTTGSSTQQQTIVPPRLQCHDHSLQLQLLPPGISVEDTSSPSASTSYVWTNNECVYVSGHMMGYNTLESFQQSDKNRLLYDYFLQRFLPKTTTTSTDDDDTHSSKMDQSIVQSLNCTLLISYADLKNHSVVYWFGMPILTPKQSIQATTSSNDDDLINKLHQQISKLRYETLTKSPDDGMIPYFIYCSSTNTCLPLSKESYRTISQSCNAVDDIFFGFLDPLYEENHSTTTTHTVPHMGWPLRNMIAYLSFHCNLGGQDVSIISYRPNVLRRIDLSNFNENNNNHDNNNNKNHCIIFKVRIPTKDDYDWSSSDTNSNSNNSYQYKVVGWELNTRNKPGPRSVNLRPLLDTNHLAIQAADLNLKLMKWRMIPNLQVEQLQSIKVLLVGAGTLGCNVARVLLGWGIRNIKIIDYGKVSYSNPVRQSLFTINDCNADNGSGKMKAIAAADALKTIAADVVSEGIVLSIPMPGHPDKIEIIQNAVTTLDELVQEADVVYLLTDTRESRWLPTVICSAYNKILINAALGLDSWLVMRHGSGPVTSTEQQQQQQEHNIVSNNHQRLGCYFCSDVVAPENSTKNRTLDQQCTVTRPGLALIASSMAVELMVSLLHHPKQIFAPAPRNNSNTTNSNTSSFSPILSSNDDSITAASSTLGIIPHSIRGSLVTYTMMTPTIPAFQYCTGCSNTIIDAYSHDKINFVQQCCQTTDGSYLEEISGLTAYRLSAAEKLVDVEGWEDDE